VDAIPSALIREAKQQNSVTTGTGESFAGCRPKTFMASAVEIDAERLALLAENPKARS